MPEAPDDATAAIIQEAMDDEQRHRQREFWRGRPKLGDTIMELSVEQAVRDYIADMGPTGGCNRIANGHCSNRNCFVEGGYSGTGPIGGVLATCPRWRLEEALTRPAAVDAGVVEAVAELQLAAFLAGRGSVTSMKYGTRTAKPAPTMNEFRAMASAALASRPQGDGVAESFDSEVYPARHTEQADGERGGK